MRYWSSFLGQRYSPNENALSVGIVVAGLVNAFINLERQTSIIYSFEYLFINFSAAYKTNKVVIKPLLLRFDIYSFFNLNNFYRKRQV